MVYAVRISYRVYLACFAPKPKTLFAERAHERHSQINQSFIFTESAFMDCPYRLMQNIFKISLEIHNDNISLCTVLAVMAR
jgi:hypothetical protein